MLEVVSVTKYYGALAAVRDVSFTVRPGDVLGYPKFNNGSGEAFEINHLRRQNGASGTTRR